MKTKCTKVGAVLFAAAAILSSCSNDDVVNNGDNTPVGDRDAVKTSFSFAIPSPVSRATETDVQADGNFQGMKNLRLMPFALASGDYVAETSVLAGATQLTGSSIGTQSENFVQTFPNVVIPAGNIAFLFYGEANHAADYNGVLNMTPDVSVTSLSPADISFSLQNITEGTYTGGTYANAADLIAAWKTNVTDKLNSWVTGLADGADKTSAEELQTNYYKFNSASLMGLKLALQYLSTRLAELNTIAGASEVKTSVDAMATALENKAYKDFPANLPKGTYKLDNGKIVFDANGPSGSGIVTATSSKAYSYPSSLYYWTNAYPVEYTTTPTFDKWNNGVYDTGTDPDPDRRSVITSASKKIALNKTINYGVARLDVKAAIKTTDGATIPAGTISGTSTPTHVTLDNHNFVVKGLLIGGLPDALDWEMHPADDDQYTKIVYDTRVPNNGYTLTYATTPSYTGINPLMYCLLPETADCSTGSADDLGRTPNIALEILNDGPQFYGLDGNLIPEDGTFYLVGKLTYAQDASKPEVTRVFQQDYNTTVHLTISSLAKAYNTVPDLINPRLELALAVDINWKAGLILDVPLGN